MKGHFFQSKLQTKLILGLILMVTVLVSCLTQVTAALYRSRMEDYYVKLAFDQATIAAQMIDGDAVRKYYTTGEKDTYYQEIHDYLLKVKQTVGLKYFYVVVPEDEVMYYIWDSGVSGEEGVCELGDVDSYYGGGNELMHAAFAADADQTILITNNEEYGYLASAYVSILDSQGQPVALASVDVSMDMINQQINQFILITLLVTAGVLVISILLYYVYLRRQVVRPIGLITANAQTFINHRTACNKDLDQVHTGDELQILARSLAQMEVDIVRYIENLASVTAEKERIGAELNVATQIQASMLPSIFPAFPERPEFDIYATMEPAKEVGGDFYDFFLVDADHLALVMADVSGKGVPAALFMVIAKTLLKNAAQMGLSPKEALAKVNNQLCENNEAEMFVTVWLGILEISTGKLTCANAGHEYPILRRAGRPYELVKDKHGFVLAGMEGVRYQEYTLQLSPGDELFVYTDGVAEAMNDRNELFGTDRMLDALDRHLGDGPDALLLHMKEELDCFVGESPQFDDITMLGLRYVGPISQKREET